MLRIVKVLFTSVAVLVSVGAGEPLPTTGIHLMFRHEGKDYTIRHQSVLVRGELIASGVFIIPEEVSASYSLGLRIKRKCFVLENTEIELEMSDAKDGLYLISPPSEVHCLSAHFDVPEPEVLMRGEWQREIKDRFIEFISSRREPIQSPEPTAPSDRGSS